MYVSIDEARERLRQRWRNDSLRRKIEEYVGDIPELLRREPCAVLARHVTSPNFEFLRFAETARRHGLTPVCIEYTGDIFCSRNPDKRLTAKMTFFHGRGRKGGNRLTCRTVIDFNEYDGVALRDVKTLWGEAFVDFHHRLLALEAPAMTVIDVTGWLMKMGGSPERFWPKIFALFAGHGILFDNFHHEGHEARFTRQIILPALAEAQNRLGSAPLVVALTPVPGERRRYWSWYPSGLEKTVREAMEQLEHPPPRGRGAGRKERLFDG